MNIENFMNKYAPIVARDDRPNEPGEVVGIIDRKHRVAWVVSPHREDQRAWRNNLHPYD
jgi:hypothetical protein